MHIIVFLLTLLLAGPALALNDWGCPQVTSTKSSVGSTGKICYDFDANADVKFSVTGSAALACLQLDGATGSTATLYYCPGGDTSDKTDCFTMAPPAGASLTGAGGNPSTQLACLSVQRGVYIVDLVAGTATSLFVVEGSQ